MLAVELIVFFHMLYEYSCAIYLFLVSPICMFMSVRIDGRCERLSVKAHVNRQVDGVVL